MLSRACGTEFTAAVARIEHRGRPVFERAYGTTRDDAFARPVYVDTRFDLASLTKLFSATAALQCVADGAIALDEPLTRWFPRWKGTPHETITLRRILAHDAGFNSGADFRQLLGYNVEEYALDRELIGVPGEKVVYSDLGFIALGALLERVRGAALTRVVRDAGAMYRPALPEHRDIPATEDDGWRGRVQGVVHDEKAYFMGGVAGHAGLFGTAADVARLGERFLGALCGRGSNGLPIELVSDATREQAADPVLRRGLGWALKTSDQNSCGPRFSASSFGHTGFVGTCIWADPAADLQGVLLTNTVYFGRRDTVGLRAAFYSALVDEVAA
ncbi:MAG TPA: serine hydrolase domain-containing protein [Candidatus Baltobacteraceae bacterium]